MLLTGLRGKSGLAFKNVNLVNLLEILAKNASSVFPV
jgi:hypothetical protein